MMSAARVAAVAVLFATGCSASPPVRARLGGTYHPIAVNYVGPDDTIVKAHGVTSYAIGAHAASAAELPLDVGLGVMGDFYRHGYYLEGAALRRVRPWLRAGATGAVEWWKHREEGIGGRVGVTAEWTSQATAFAGTKTDKCVTSSSAYSGVRAVGLYVDVGYRSMFDERNAVSINIGLSVRWPVFAVIAYGFSGGGSSCD